MKKGTRLLVLILAMAVMAPLLMGATTTEAAAPEAAEVEATVEDAAEEEEVAVSSRAVAHLDSIMLHPSSHPFAAPLVEKSIILSKNKTVAKVTEGNCVKYKVGVPSLYTEFMWYVNTEGHLVVIPLKTGEGSFTFVDTEGGSYSVAYRFE